VYGRLVIGLLALVIVSLSIVVSADSSVSDGGWSNGLSSDLMRLLDKVIGVNTSVYRIDSVRLEDCGPGSCYYIVWLKRDDNSTVRTSVIVDSNSKIVTLLIQNIVPGSDFVKKYRLDFLRKISPQAQVISLDSSDAEALLGLVLNVMDTLSTSSPAIRELQGRISLPVGSAELESSDPSLIKVRLSTGNDTLMRLVIHGDVGVVNIYIYSRFTISEGITYDHPVLGIVLRSLPGDGSVFAIYGLDYEPYAVRIYMADKLGKPEDYVGNVVRDVEDYLSRTSSEKYVVKQVKPYDVYGKTVEVAGDTKVIRLYYTYIVETDKYSYMVHLDPLSGSAVNIEIYGSYREPSSVDNTGVDAPTSIQPVTLAITTSSILGIAGLILLPLKRRAS